mgnify:CR=1 FL=1
MLSSTGANNSQVEKFFQKVKVKKVEGIKVLGHAELRGEVVDDISATYTLHRTIEAFKLLLSVLTE